MRTIFYISAVIFLSISCKKDDVKPTNNISYSNPLGISMDLKNSNLYTSNNFSLTTNYTYSSDSDKYIQRNIYFSKDKSFSEQDILLSGNYGGYMNSLIKGANQFSNNILIPTSVDTGSYYLITRYRTVTNYNNYNPTYGNYYEVSTDKMLNISKTISKVKIINVKVNKNLVTSGSSISLTINYTSTNAKQLSGNINCFLTSDSSKLTSDGFVNSSINFDLTFDPSQLNFIKSITLPAVSTNGKYFLVLDPSYTEDGIKYFMDKSFIKLDIKPLADLVYITDITTDKTNYKYGDAINISGKMNNATEKDVTVSLTYYLSKDTVYSTTDQQIYYASNSSVYTPNTTKFSEEFNFGSNINYGYFYLILKSYTYVGGTDYGNKFFVGPKINYVEPLTTVTQMTIESSSLNISPGFSIKFNTTNKSDLNDSQYKYYNIYLSLNSIWTEDDYFLNSESFDFKQGTSFDAHSVNVPSSIPLGSYYLIAKSANNNNGETDKEYLSSNKVTISNPSSVFYRNNTSTINGFYLFIDDVYAYTFTSYYSYGGSSCTTFSSSYDYGYSFIYRGSYGFHTYKICTTDNLSTGIITKSGNFTVNSSSCITVDVD